MNLVHALTIALASALVFALPARPASADAGERIPTYDVVLRLGGDGVLRVRETITYDFDGGEHGIVRRVPYRVGNRLYAIGNVRTSSSTGAPARVRAAKLLHEVRITVGDGRRTVRGRQAYVIEYDVAGAFTRHAEAVELRWDATGAAWDVPIGEVSVRVEAPVVRPKVTCWAGATGGLRGSPGAVLTRCGRDRDGLYAVDFTQSGLGPREGVLIKARLPRGSVEVPPPVYAQPYFTGSWPGFTALALGAALGALCLLRRRSQGAGRAWRTAGTGLAAAGSAAVAADVLDEMIGDGVWAASVGDLALLGGGLLAAGIMMLVPGPRPIGAEPAAMADHRA